LIQSQPSAHLRYRAIPSPLGELFLAATDEGLCRIAWFTPEAAFVMDLEEEWQQPAVRERTRTVGVLEAAARQLARYFAGQRQSFDLPLDLTRTRPFQREVLLELIKVPYGEVVTYGELAELCGRPRAARAVGGAMRSNPLPIVIPCHRVLPSSGGLGGFGGRPELKQRLLEIEGWRGAGNR
jgi:methylated-DNA-[protein]-cysteine S-methyltransferase